MSHSTYGVVLAVLLALVPGLVHLAWGPRLSRHADDPDLPERLAAFNKRVGYISLGCIAVLVSLGRMWLWALPLSVAMQWVGGFPLRKTLYGETWNLAAFLSFFARLWIGMRGFWLLVAITPLLVWSSGRFELLASLGLGALMIVCLHFSDAILRALLRARPIADRALLDRFEALVAKAGLRPPRFEYVAMNGGMYANALAVPSTSRASVVFMDTLLARLTENEIVGICAHELAHLEDFDRGRLRTMRLWMLGLALAAVAFAPAMRQIAGPDDFLVTMWTFATFIGLALAGQRWQEIEKASDMRAVELTGDPESLVSGLTKVHELLLLPRRWDEQTERTVTHPSLEQRIHDIRGSAERPVVDAPVTFEAADGSQAATFHPTHVEWRNASGGIDRLDYGTLFELRVNVSAFRRILLVAVDTKGRIRKMPPRPSDIEDLRAIATAARLKLAKRSERPFSAAVVRLVAGLVTGLALLVGQIPFAVVALAATLTPASALLWAASAAGVTAGVFLRASGSDVLALSTLLFALAALLVPFAWIRRRETVRGSRVVMAMLGVATAALVASLGAAGLNPIRLSQAAQSSSGPIVLLAACAVACGTWNRRRALRIVAGGLAAAAIAAWAMRTPTFLEGLGRDPLLLPAEPFAQTTFTAAPVSEFGVPFEVDMVRVSPGGRLAAVAAEPHDDRANPNGLRFHVGGAGSHVSVLDADDLAFLDDDRVLTYVTYEHSSEIRVVDVASSSIAWRLRLPNLVDATVTFAPRSGRWTVVGEDAEKGVMRVTGIVGGTDAERTVWPIQEDPRWTGDGWVDGFSTRGATLLAVTSTGETPPAGDRGARWLPRTLTAPHYRAEIWSAGGGTTRGVGRSLLMTSCAPHPLANGGLVCTAFDGTRSRVLTLDPETGSPTAIGLVNRGFFPRDVHSGDWLTGRSRDGVLAVRVSTREAILLKTGDVDVAAASDTAFATAVSTGDAALVRIYRHK